jgi:hypothetical protein
VPPKLHGLHLTQLWRCRVPDGQFGAPGPIAWLTVSTIGSRVRVRVAAQFAHAFEDCVGIVIAGSGGSLDLPAACSTDKQAISLCILQPALLDLCTISNVLRESEPTYSNCNQPPQLEFGSASVGVVCPG